jgi:hypothetical protein
MKVRVNTKNGGAVEFCDKPLVWAAFYYDGLGTGKRKLNKDLLFAHADLNDGRRVSFFLNRATGLVVVDVIDKTDEGGVEILRRVV